MRQREGGLDPPGRSIRLSESLLAAPAAPHDRRDKHKVPGSVRPNLASTVMVLEAGTTWASLGTWGPSQPYLRVPAAPGAKPCASAPSTRCSRSIVASTGHLPSPHMVDLLASGLRDCTSQLLVDNTTVLRLFITSDPPQLTAGQPQNIR